MSQDEELAEVIRRLRAAGVPIPLDTPRADFYRVLSGTLTQMDYTQALADVAADPHACAQLSTAHDAEAEARAVVDEQFAASPYLRSLSR